MISTNIIQNFMEQSKLAKIIHHIKPSLQSEGVGAKVRRYIGTSKLRNFDPFLMLDYFEGKLPTGFPDHPHRGFQTLTYLHSGTFFHEDFLGNNGILEPFGIQWMIAGKGIVHSEIPGSFEESSIGLQLWINLPAKDKMIDPYYLDRKKEEIPFVEKDGVKARVICGEVFDTKGCINEMRTPIDYIDFDI